MRAKKLLSKIIIVLQLSVIPIYAQQSYNGDFETGDFTGWTVSGPHSAYVHPFYQGSCCAVIHIYSGNASGQSTPNNKWQMVGLHIIIPETAEFLNFYMEVNGIAWHNGGYVWIMDADSVGKYTQLYHSGSGDGIGQHYPWEFHEVNIEPWASRNVTIYFAGHNSNGNSDHVVDIYFDNIRFSPTTTDNIQPTITLDAPNGAELWTEGETQEIRWTADDDMYIRADSVFYSIDNGVIWTFIATHSGNCQKCDWDIPDTPSDQSLIKVVVYDAGNHFATDMSNSVFTIASDNTPPTVQIIRPNGGENWNNLDWQNIAWTSDDNVEVGGDSIYYSVNNGADWMLIGSHTGKVNSFSFGIPNTPSDQCLVKVKVFDKNGNWSEDISNNTFTISYQEPPALTYAVVIKQSTYYNPVWKAVADTVKVRYQGRLFIWKNTLDEVRNDIALYHPSYIGFVCELATASPDFIQNSVWPFVRGIDDDVYTDAVWGIITGYNSGDALKLVTGPVGFEVKTVLGGTASCDVAYYTQGIGTSESTCGLYYVKHPDSLEITTKTDGLTDRTEWLVTMINNGIDIFNYDPVDIFYTSGHGNVNLWQLHYPTVEPEGFFRSGDGKVFGDPYTGDNIYIKSNHPKIYFGLGNCYIGKIDDGGCMAPSWIHSGGAYQYTGYVVPEGSNSYQHGGIKAYFYKVARNNTWAESYFLANIALQFDIINGTPGADPSDLNGSALYGDPGMQVKMSTEGIYKQPLFKNELTINKGTEKDTVTYKITMNREGNPGFTGKWGDRHPATILPFRTERIEIINTDAMTVVIKDNFALMYIWHQGQPSLAEGDTREVVFTCNHISTAIDEQMPLGTEVEKINLYQNYPNPFNPSTKISYHLPKSSKVSVRIYNINGQLVETLVDDIFQESGYHSVVWDVSQSGISSGIYFYRITYGNFCDTKKCVIIR
ncbi:MAG: T9SS type A sorting domain-containing protein [archaeon]